MSLPKPTLGSISHKEHLSLIAAKNELNNFNNKKTNSHPEPSTMERHMAGGKKGYKK